jgi:hypothetical protein
MAFKVPVKYGNLTFQNILVSPRLQWLVRGSGGVQVSV